MPAQPLGAWSDPTAVMLRHELANALVSLRWLSEGAVAELEPEEAQDFLVNVTRRVSSVLAGMRALDDLGANVVVPVESLTGGEPAGGAYQFGTLVKAPNRIIEFVMALRPSGLRESGDVLIVTFHVPDAAKWARIFEQAWPECEPLSASDSFSIELPRA